ncbi:MAG TPA: PDZ domain-containing protein [Pyrinomonadaceae bacterium]
MTLRKLIRVTTIAGTLLYCAAAVAQTPAPSPKRPAPPVKVGRAGADKLPAAPQVVTIIHRLNALKMFRLLLRSEQYVQSVDALDSVFNLMDDVHTNVIAGLAMDDGTIAAWLPEAEVELGPPDMAPLLPVAPRAPKPPRASRFGVVDVPDITVIGPEGKRLAAKYVGLDVVTGLSILRLVNKNAVQAVALTDEPLHTGATVLLFSPEPVANIPGAQAMLRGNLYARMGAIEGRIRDVMPAPSGGVARFKMSAPKLSRANIGGVAVNEAGETIGIVDGLVEGNEASILPAALIRRAAQRVLEQQASVPRPWLGVKGEAITALNLDQIQNHGWELQRAEALAGKHRGILLTSVAPDSPAAKASLKAGDVILKVDDKEIQTADDFTWWLEQAGPSSLVEFTVARPDQPAEDSLNVRLSGLLYPAVLSFNLRTRFPKTRTSSLMEQGIETIALKPPVATQLGTTAGLLVVYVEPSTAASEAGLQPGDVIQSIDGKPVSAFKPPAQPTSFTFEIFRNKEKLVVVVPAKKN